MVIPVALFLPVHVACFVLPGNEGIGHQFPDWLRFGNVNNGMQAILHTGLVTNPFLRYSFGGFRRRFEASGRCVLDSIRMTCVDVGLLLVVLELVYLSRYELHTMGARRRNKACFLRTSRKTMVVCM